MTDSSFPRGNVWPLRLAEAVPFCHLCPDDDRARAPAGPVFTVTYWPAFGPARLVSLCAHCQLGRPSRKHDELGPADLAWRVLERDTTRLLTAHGQKHWTPSAGESDFAACLARAPWTEESMRAAVRDADDLVYAGRLLRALDNNAIVVLRHVPADDLALHSLRRLVDVLATEVERPPGGRA
ncbi:hypothetical protein ACFWSF_37660 [Streptomyces sp. NPDC058611]|uniref:hypothetical protein n=1 Tax=unclassified Streptomyces TaxID=2593676 RepID=UPI00365723E4